MLERFQALDIEIFTFVHQGLWHTLWLPVLVVLQYVGSGVEMALLIVSALLLVPKEKRRRFLVLILVPVGVASLIAFGLKEVVHSDRPRMIIPELVLNPNVPKHYSWPSGHTTAAFAFAVAVIMLRLSSSLPARTWTFFTVLAVVDACIIGTARVAVGAHWPSDVLAGAILGTSVSYAVCRLLYTVEEKRH